MLLILLFAFFINSYSLQPSDLIKCKTCKWFINNKKSLQEEEGLCKLFSKILMNKNKRIIRLYNTTDYCRKHENICGKKGKLHMPIEENNKNTTISTQEIIEQRTENNDDTTEKILNMTKESYDYYNFLTGKLDRDPTIPE
jgi:flavodoxin